MTPEERAKKIAAYTCRADSTGGACDCAMDIRALAAYEKAEG